MKHLFSCWVALLWAVSAFAQPSIIGDLSVLSCTTTTYNYALINPPCQTGAGCQYNFELLWVNPSGIPVSMGTTVQSGASYTVNWNSWFFLNNSANNSAPVQVYFIRSWITGCSSGACNLSSSNAVVSQDIVVTACNTIPVITGYMSPLSCNTNTYFLTNVPTVPNGCQTCSYFFELLWFDPQQEEWVSVEAPKQNSTPQYSIDWSVRFSNNDQQNGYGNSQVYAIKSWIGGCTPASCNYGSASTPVFSPNIVVTRCISMGCGNITSSTHTLSGNTLTVPCGSTASTTLCAPVVPGSYSYAWTLPAGWSFASGTATNTRCVTVVPNASGSGTISVQVLGFGQESDGDANASTPCNISVNRQVPATAPTWTQTHSLICNNQAKTFSIAPSSVPNAVYEWEASGGFLFAGCNCSAGSAAGATSMQVYSPATGRGQGYVRVRISTPCGKSPWATYNVCYGVPPQPATPTVSLCQSEPSASVALGTCAGSTVTWTVQPGSIVEGQGTAIMGFSLNHSQYTQGYYINVGVNTSNACGAGKQKNVAIPCTCCGGGGGIMQRMASENLMLEDTVVIHAGSVVLAPNPVKDQLTVRSDATDSPIHSIQLIDLQGKMVSQFVAPETIYETILYTGNLSAGMYVCRVQTATGQVLRKVIKE